MVSINCNNIKFICFLFYLQFANGHHDPTSPEQIARWLSADEIRQLRDENALYNLSTGNENSQATPRDIQSNDHEENHEDSLSENIIRPPLVRLNDSRENHERRNQQSPCGEGTQCKRQRDVSKIMWEESLKVHILKSLKMSSPPNISETDRLPNGSLPLRQMVEEVERLDINFYVENDGPKKSGKLVSIGKKRKFTYKFTLRK